MSAVTVVALPWHVAQHARGAAARVKQTRKGFSEWWSARTVRPRKPTNSPSSTEKLTSLTACTVSCCLRTNPSGRPRTPVASYACGTFCRGPGLQSRAYRPATRRARGSSQKLLLEVSHGLTHLRVDLHAVLDQRQACKTVPWSRPPKDSPIVFKELSVNWRARNIAI